ncbi:MAG: Hpt domain-containing protein [Campylobacterales bacterium]|nr:Hpt domain-containing protein [Campylobacterales bacterium]
MFYVLNQDNQIVAADYDFLEILEADDLQTLFVKVVGGEIFFEKLDERRVNIHSKSSLIRASHEEYVLKSTFGNLKLVKLYNVVIKSNAERLIDKEGIEAQKELPKVQPPLQDVRPQRKNLFAQEEKVEPKPKRVSIFLDDDEEPTPPKDETPKEKIADIPNKKVQEDLAVASQQLTPNKVEKKPILETLRVEEELKKEIKVQEPIEKPVALKSIHEDEKAIKETPLAQETVQEIDELMLDESHDEALKLAGISLDEPIEDEASIDELLALANQQDQSTPKVVQEKPVEKSVEKLVEKEELPVEEELKLDEVHEEEIPSAIPLEVSKEEEEALVESLLLMEEDEPLQEFVEDKVAHEDEELLLGNEEVEEIEELLLSDDEVPTHHEIKEEPKEESREDIALFDDLLLDDDEPKKVQTAPADEGLLLDNEEIEEIGNLFLDDDEEPISRQIKEEAKEEEVALIDDLLLSDDEEPHYQAPKEEPKEDIETFDELLVLDETPKTKSVKEESNHEVDAIKDLLLEIDESPTQERLPIKDYNYPENIEIDLDEYGEMIGLGAEDYQEFLNEFIDKSIVYDEDLRSQDKEQRENSLNELYSISQSLQLPYLEDILADMLQRSYLEEELVDTYYDCLAKVTTKREAQVEEVSQVEEIEEEEISIEEPPKEETPKEEPPVASGYGVLNFEGIKPIHFDFRLEEAAEDLSLPVDLIEEFVNDFIEQAIEEKETFIKAYAKGDMDTIQKTGHKLKGASSNLRIIPLSETLEEIQHCDNPARFEPLLKKYWGQFLSFKLFMENISHK